MPGRTGAKGEPGQKGQKGEPGGRDGVSKKTINIFMYFENFYFKKHRRN